VTFGTPYADVYDVVYADKEYEAECDVIEAMFRRFADERPVSLLDLGCGTGRHATTLAARGYEVVGVDRSESMLDHAQRRASASSNPTFVAGDIRSLELGRTFDAALMMFAVLGYQTGDNDVVSALSSVRRHLETRGLLLFDAWYGPAVLHQRPGDRHRTIPSPEGPVVRTSSGRLDIDRHVCAVRVNVNRYRGSEPVGATEEEHLVRYFFPEELSELLRSADLDLLHMSSFPDVSKPPDETSWSFLAVARAI